MHNTELLSEMSQHGDVTIDAIETVVRGMAKDRKLRDEINRRVNWTNTCGRELDDFGEPVPPLLVTLGLPKNASLDEIMQAINQDKERNGFNANRRSPANVDLQRQYDELIDWRQRGQRYDNGHTLRAE